MKHVFEGNKQDKRINWKSIFRNSHFKIVHIRSQNSCFANYRIRFYVQVSVGIIYGKSRLNTVPSLLFSTIKTSEEENVFCKFRFKNGSRCFFFFLYYVGWRLVRRWFNLENKKNSTRVFLRVGVFTRRKWCSSFFLVITYFIFSNTCTYYYIHYTAFPPSSICTYNAIEYDTTLFWRSYATTVCHRKSSFETRIELYYLSPLMYVCVCETKRCLI